MSGSLRAFLWGFAGVLLAGLMTLGAFAIAGRSIGEPAPPPRVPAVELEHGSPATSPDPDRDDDVRPVSPSGGGDPRDDGPTPTPTTDDGANDDDRGDGGDGHDDGDSDGTGSSEDEPHDD